MNREPFEYDQIYYNELIYWLENRWQRKLTEHEINLAKLAYRFGRLTEMDNEIQILYCK